MFSETEYANSRANLLPSFAGAMAIHPGPTNLNAPALPGLNDREVLVAPDDEVLGQARVTYSECRSALMDGAAA